MKKLKINSDVGEGVEWEAELMPFLDSCSIACGGHFGDVFTMRKSVELAIANNVKIGAHPSYPDKKGFGRNKINITSFQDLIYQANKEKEIELRFDLERNVKLVSFDRGKINISFNEKLNKNFIKDLTEKLLLWTGERWIISLSKNNEAKSIYEQNMENKSSQLSQFEKSDTAKLIKKAFPDAQLIDIKEKQDD